MLSFGVTAFLSDPGSGNAGRRAGPRARTRVCHMPGTWDYSAPKCIGEPSENNNFNALGKQEISSKLPWGEATCDCGVERASEEWRKAGAGRKNPLPR